VFEKKNMNRGIPKIHQHPETRIAMNIEEIYHPGDFL